MRSWKRAALIIVGVVLAVGAAAPFLSADRFRGRIQSALEQSLNRKVEVGRITFNLLTGPGFTVKDVTIHEDPSVGLEPFAYVDTVRARVRLWSLLSHRLSFSTLRLIEPSVNVAKRDDGIWNFQLFLNRTRSPKDPPGNDFPEIEIRSGRVNFKFGDVKSSFYVADADVDLDPAPDRLDFRFRGEPARADRAAQSFGKLLFRGTWRRQPGAESALDVNAELERSAAGEVIKLIEGHDIGLHGVLASRAHIYGPISQLTIAGQVRLDDVHRWDLMPQRGDGWNLNYRGRLDLWNQKLRVETVPADTPSLPLLVRFDASNYLSVPSWALTVDFRDVPSTTLLETARHLGAPLPSTVTADGKVTGVIGYSAQNGLQGQVRFENTSLKLPSSDPIAFQSANVLIDNSSISVGPAVVQMPNNQSAELEGSYSLDTGNFRMRISTAAMDIAQLHSGTGRVLGAGSLPILEHCRQGTWKGSVVYSRESAGPGRWSGDLDVHNVRLDVPGVAGPVLVSAGSLSLDDDKAAFTKLRGTAGKIAFTGDFHSPHRLRLDVPTVSLTDLESLFLPSLRRTQSLLSRTFRMGRVVIPEWLRARHIDAQVKIGNLAIGGDEWRVNRARVRWAGPSVEITDIDTRLNDASASGVLRLNLEGRYPSYSAEGRISSLEYKGGELAVDGLIEADGIGADLLASAHGEGTFNGQDIGFASDVHFESFAGAFALAPGGRLRLTPLQVSQGGEMYTGQGTSQPDGKLLLELSGPKRQLRLVGSLVGAATALPQ